LVSKRGKKKALVAVGHKILIACYFVIKNNEPYKEPVLHNHPKKQKNKAKHHLAKLKELGYEVEIKKVV